MSGARHVYVNTGRKPVVVMAGHRFPAGERVALPARLGIGPESDLKASGVLYFGEEPERPAPVVAPDKPAEAKTTIRITKGKGRPRGSY